MQDQTHFQGRPAHGHPQNIQMIPQGAGHQLQPYTQFNQSYGFEPNQYGNVHPAVIQQGFVCQGVPVNPHMAMYPNPGYPPHRIPNNRPPLQAAQQSNSPLYNPQIAVSDQIHLVKPSNQAFMIETTIKSGFCCYTCLIYFGLISSILGILSTLSGPLNLGAKFISIFIAAAFIKGYVLTIQAKSTFDSKKQYQAYIIFCVMTVAKLLANILSYEQSVKELKNKVSLDERNHSYNYNARETEDFVENLFFFMIVITLLMEVILVYSARLLTKVLKKRDQILTNMDSPTRVA